MRTFIFIILVAVCSIFVYNIVCSLKEDHKLKTNLTPYMTVVVSAVLGIILACLLRFFMRYVFIPLVVLVLLYLIVTCYKNKRRF